MRRGIASERDKKAGDAPTLFAGRATYDGRACPYVIVGEAKVDGGACLYEKVGYASTL